MAELERDLRLLGATIELPPERDLVPGVRARLAARRQRRRRGRVLVAAVVVAVVVAVGVALAVPPARSAILRFLGLESVTVFRVDTLPPAARGPAAVGERTTLAEARRRLGFRPLLPDGLEPDAVYLGAAGGGLEPLVLVYGRREVRLRITEVRAAPRLFEKFAGRFEPVDVAGHPGLWFPERHVVVEPFGEPRLAGRVLVWEQGGVTIRIEGRLSKEQALHLASSLR